MASQRINHQPVFLLASAPWRENSLWLEVYSRTYGRVALLARSARTRQSELRGVLVPFVPMSASWYGTQELKTLHRAEWLGGWPQPQGRALFAGLYVNELMLKLTAREDPQPRLYDALAEVMQAVCREPNHVAALRRFEWTLLTELGCAPDLSADESGAAVEAARHYWVRPDEAVCLWQGSALPPMGEVVAGSTLLQLSAGEFDANGLREALKITRCLIDYRLPEGVKSRQILLQMEQFSLALGGTCSA